MVPLAPGDVGLATWRAIWAGDTPALDAGARGAIERSAAAVASILAGGEAVYGVNTGFGKLASVRIASGDVATLQRNLILSHCAGVGPLLDACVVRLAMALKIASLARGASGVRMETVALLEQMLARGIVPCIPGQGSVGASGDLAPLAHMSAVLIGEGEAYVDGVRLPGAQALAGAGLAPVVLGAKEGLALINGTQISTALALAALFRMERLLAGALVAGALSTDAAAGSDTPFDPRIHALRGHAGQTDVAAVLRTLLAGSAIRDSHRMDDVRVQDPYCLRCMPQVMGAALDLMRMVARTLHVEANGVSDNPLVFADTGEVLSGGNFHAEPVAFAADMLALGMAEIGNMSERRSAMLVDPVMSGLPAFLVREPGLNSGFMIAQVTAAALASENKQRAAPASIDTIPTSANQEDHVSMATHAARRLHDMADNLAHILGIEILEAAQGIDMRRPLRSSAAIEAAHMQLRSQVAFMGVDRIVAPDIEAAARMVADGSLAQAAGVDVTHFLERA